MLDRVQAHLEAIYALEPNLRVDDFLVTPEVARALGHTGRSHEELLVHEDGDGLEVALVLDPALLRSLERYRAAPAEQLLDAALDSYCQVTEGVSHFLYLTHSAAKERRVSLLELEAQAEVDKFASCVLHAWRRGVRFAEQLLRRLFDFVRYLPTLAAHERWRYQEANRLARRYCRRLLRHIAEGRMDRFLTELRYCYRLGAEAKLQYLAQ
ncbi:MAG: hypothetical protein IRZ16_23560 [Myxococcaceae bacterium]|nr:hypothetical protein [Myxococcaceae bacterium]